MKNNLFFSYSCTFQELFDYTNGAILTEKNSHLGNTTKLADLLSMSRVCSCFRFRKIHSRCLICLLHNCGPRRLTELSTVICPIRSCWSIVENEPVKTSRNACSWGANSYIGEQFIHKIWFVCCRQSVILSFAHSSWAHRPHQLPWQRLCNFVVPYI